MGPPGDTAISCDAGREAARRRRSRAVRAVFLVAFLGIASWMLRGLDAGPLARVQRLARRTGLPRASIFGSIVMDYLMNAAGMMLGLGLLSLFLPIWALEIVVIAITLRAVGLRLPVSAAFVVLLAVSLALALPFAPPGNVGTLEVGATLALVGFRRAKGRGLGLARLKPTTPSRTETLCTARRGG
jgi:hypothetical protein